MGLRCGGRWVGVVFDGLILIVNVCPKAEISWLNLWLLLVI